MISHVFPRNPSPRGFNLAHPTLTILSRLVLSTPVSTTFGAIFFLLIFSFLSFFCRWGIGRFWCVFPSGAFEIFPFFAFDSLSLFPLFRPLDEETVLFADEFFVQHIVLEITLTAAAQPEAKESRRTWMEQLFTRVKLPAYQPQGSITLGHVSRCCLLLMCSSSRGEVMWGTYSTSE